MKEAQVMFAVIINGRLAGTVGNREELVDFMTEQVEPNYEVSQRWLAENVQLLPLLSEEPAAVTWDVDMELSIELDESGWFLEETFEIEDTGAKFDSAEELFDYVREGVRSGEITSQQANEFTIKKTSTTELTLDIDTNVGFDWGIHIDKELVSDYYPTESQTEDLGETNSEERTANRPGYFHRYEQEEPQGTKGGVICAPIKEHDGVVSTEVYVFEEVILESEYFEEFLVNKRMYRYEGESMVSIYQMSLALSLKNEAGERIYKRIG